jgi:hypothetical protein
MPDRNLFSRNLADAAFTGRRFFHLGPHSVQIVAGRDHRKQQNERATKNAQKHQRRNG